jgi:1,4-alpha-glucan branching enzyme
LRYLKRPWHALKHRFHTGVQRWIKDLNQLCQLEPALHERDCSPDGFEWIDFNDRTNTTLFFLRKAGSRDDLVLAEDRRMLSGRAYE